jgi:hypothetical protein
VAATDGKASKRSQRTEETKVVKDLKDLHAAKESQGAKATVVSATVTKSIMAKAAGNKLRESPRDDATEARSTAATTSVIPSSVAEIPVAIADASAVVAD